MTCKDVICHTAKPIGLLQPLSIQTHIWEDIFLDFISSLPKSGGLDVILVVVDLLTKYIHCLGRYYIFSRYHASNKDLIFISSFRTKLFKLK